MLRKSGLCVYASLRALGESLLLREEAKEFSAGTVLKSEVELGVGLEGGLDANEEGMVNLCKDISFHHDLLDLVVLLNIFLLHRFQRIEMLGDLVAYQHHFRK